MKTSNIFAALIIATAFAACSEGTKVNYSTAPVEKQNITTSITATGTIEPVTEVEVGTQVSGIIDRIYVDYNSEVHRGQVIAELDKTNLLSKLASAQSNLSNAQSSLNYQSANYKRYKTLYEKGLVSANDYENAKLSYEQALQQVKVQQQNVTEAQTNLGYATITSPIDGVVLSKEVEEGQTVASAMTTPTLFIIAQDLTDMRVIADIDEADIGGVKEGQRVTFTVDAFPDDIFEGAVTQVRQQATTESNVVTYEVVISAPNDQLKLKPGLTANVTIYTLEKNGVLAVPARALRFTPNEALLQEGETVEDVQSPFKVWTKEGNVFKAHKVEVGLSNGMLTEIISGVKAGTEVLTDFEIIGGEEESEEPATSNPFMPRPGNRNRNGANGAAGARGGAPGAGGAPSGAAGGGAGMGGNRPAGGGNFSR
jgi:HlyD family secretion protein